MDAAKRGERAGGIFVALSYRDYRLLWIGLLVSNVGTWMQYTATGFYVARLAGSPHAAALDLGWLGAARALAVLICSPPAGVAADRIPRRRILFVANLAMALAALAMAVLLSADRLTMPWLVVLSAVNSAAQAFDSPARQSWMPILVAREHVGSAIGLNSVAFNAPAVVGPALAAGLIATAGLPASFYANALATLAVVAAVALMRPAPPSDRARDPIAKAITEGIRFLLSHRVLRGVVAVFALTALTARSYAALLPALVVSALGGGPGMLGAAASAVGIGGFAGALVTAYLGRYRRRGWAWLVTGGVMSAGVASLAIVRNVWILLPVLFTIGAATLAFVGLTNTLIQLLAPETVRGRAVAVYTMIALGFVPGGALLVGALAAVIGLDLAFACAGCLCVIALAAVWRRERRLHAV